MLRIPDVTVEILAIPKRSRTAKDRIGATGAELLPGLDDLAQVGGPVRADEHMRMVGHDAPGLQLIPATVAEKEAALEDLGDVGSGQPALARSAEASIRRRRS